MDGHFNLHESEALLNRLFFTSIDTWSAKIVNSKEGKDITLLNFGNSKNNDIMCSSTKYTSFL